MKSATVAARATAALAVLGATALGFGVTFAADKAEAKRYCRQEYCAKPAPVVCRRAKMKKVCTGGGCLQTGVRVVECGR